MGISIFKCLFTWEQQHDKCPRSRRWRALDFWPPGLWWPTPGQSLQEEQKHRGDNVPMWHSVLKTNVGRTATMFHLSRYYLDDTQSAHYGPRHLMQTLNILFWWFFTDAEWEVFKKRPKYPLLISLGNYSLRLTPHSESCVQPWRRLAQGHFDTGHWATTLSRLCTITSGCRVRFPSCHQDLTSSC